MPLSQLASVQIVEGPAQISREDTRRRLGVELNVRGRDIGSLVKQAEAVLERDVRLSSGYNRGLNLKSKETPPARCQR